MVGQRPRHGRVGASEHPRGAPLRGATPDYGHSVERAQHTPRCSRRNNGPMQAATGVPRTREGPPTARRSRARAGVRAAITAQPERAVRALAAVGLAGVLASVFLIAAGAATRPTPLVPARSGGWPGWMAGPLRGLDVGISRGSFQAYTLVMCACYLLV